MPVFVEMESPFLDASDINFFADLSISENKGDNIKCEMTEEIKSLYDEVNKEYRRYVISEILVSCYKSVSDHTHLVPHELSDKLKKMIINMDVTESITKEDENGTKRYLFGIKDEDVLQLQNEILKPEEELCLKTAVNRLLQQKSMAFRVKQNEVEKKCKILKCTTNGSTSGNIFNRINENLNSAGEISEKMKLCESLVHSISEIQQKCLELETKWKDVMINACTKVEARTELLKAESRLLSSKVVATICSENENFVKAIEILWSVLQNEIQEMEYKLKALSEKLQVYERAEQDPTYKAIVKTYNKIMRKHRHLNWCLDSMQGK